MTDKPALSNLVLHGRPGSGSAVVEALLTALRLPYDFLLTPRREPGQAIGRLADINPLEEVPTLVLGSGEVLTESCAICLFLTEQVDNPRMAPATHQRERAEFLRWMSFFAVRTYPACLRYYHPQRFTTRDDARGVSLAAAAFIESDWQLVSDRLSERDFLAGDAITAVDLYATMLLSWANGPEVASRHDNLLRLFARVRGHKGLEGVWRRNGVDL